MANFFKSFGKGLLYVVSFPFLLVGIVLYAVFGLFVFIFQLGKLIYLFFTGRSLYSDLPEDVEAKAILEKDKQQQEEKKEPTDLSLYPSDSPIYNTDGYTSPVFRDEKKDKPEVSLFTDEELDNADKEDNNDY